MATKKRNSNEMYVRDVALMHDESGAPVPTGEANPLPGIVYGPGGFAVETDQYDKAIVTIASEHYRIHNGEGYMATFKGSIPAGNTLKILLRNPAFNWPHARDTSVTISGATPCDVYLYEGATVTDTGTQVTVRNMSRPTGDGDEDLELHHGVTTSDDGTEVMYKLIPTAGLFGLGGGQDGDIGIEWVLKPDTDYIMTITNNHGSATATLGFSLFFYEG